MFLSAKVALRLTALFGGIILSLPFLLYRTIISFLMSTLFGLKMVEARSSYFLAEDFDSQNSYTSMLLIKLGGGLEVSELRKLVEARLINEPKYPELSSRVVYWMGYLFWKKDTNFRLDRHVLDLKETAIPAPDWFNPNAADILGKDLMRCRSWRRDRPLWEMVVANKNFDSNADKDLGNTTSFLVIKYHHSLCDGYAAYNVFGNLFGEVDFGKKALRTIANEVKQSKAHAKKVEESLVKRLARVIAKALPEVWNYCYAMEGARRSLPVLDATTNDFRVISATGPLQVLKNAKRKQCVDFNSIYIAGIATFYRRLLQISGHVANEDANLGVTLLMPGHSGKLSNNVILLNIVLPLGETDPNKRLQLISQQMKKLTRSYVPSFIYFLLTWLGALPHKCLKFLRGHRMLPSSPFIATNLGGPGDNLRIGNCPINGLVAAMNYPFDGPGFKIGLISCQSTVTISASVKSEFLPKDKTCEGNMVQILGECFNEWNSL